MSGALCGWCLVHDCTHCRPAGDGWTCHCTHPTTTQETKP